MYSTANYFQNKVIKWNMIPVGSFKLFRKRYEKCLHMKGLETMKTEKKSTTTITDNQHY